MFNDYVAMILGYAVIVCSIISVFAVSIYLTVSYSVGLYLKLTRGTEKFYKFIQSEFIARKFNLAKKKYIKLDDIDKLIEAHKVDEVMTVNIKTVSDIMEFFNQHLETLRKSIHEKVKNEPNSNA